MTIDLTVESSLLAYALATGGSVSPSRTTLPVLSNVLLKAEKGKLQVSGSNAETSITAWISAEIKEEGVITVPEDLFSGIIKSLAAGQEVRLKELPNMSLQIECGPVNTAVKGISAEEFPNVLVEKLGSGSLIPAAEFKKIIRQVGLAANPDASKGGILQGINFTMNGTSLTAAATDQTRLAIKTVTIQNGYPSNFAVPATSLDRVVKSMNTVMPDVQLHVVGNSQVVWNVPGKLQIITSQLAGRFPDVQRVIPQKESATNFRVNKREMLSACNLVELFANQGSGMATLSATAEKIRLLTAEETVGNADYDVEGKGFTGAPARVFLNARNFRESVESFTGDEVMVFLNGDHGPVLLKAADEEKLTHLMMPMVLS